MVCFIRRIAFLMCMMLGASAAVAQDVGRTIVVFDASGSMWGQIDGKAKITIAQEVMDELLITLPDTQELGLTAYGHRRKGDCSDIESLVAPAAGTKGAIAAAVHGIKPKGRTPLSAAVIAAAKELRYTEEKATVILVSDGKETCDFDPCEVGRALEEAGVDFTAHVIGFDVANPIDRAQLQCLAENTGGSFRTASNAAELSEALKVVAEPPAPPSPRHVKFIAVEGSENGPQIRDDLIWTLTNTGTGDVIIRDSAVTALDEMLPPGAYRAEVLNAKDENRAALDVRVMQNTDATFVLVLPYSLPDATVEGPATAVAGSEIEVIWTGPDEAGDWIGTALPEQDDGSWATYSYSSDGSPLKLRMPATAGQYELRYVLNARKKVLATQVIDITPVTATLEFAATVAAGADISVNWTGPGYEGDFITVVKPGADPGSWIKYTYTTQGSPLNLTMPAEPGVYEVRYVMAQNSATLATETISVEAVSVSLDAPAEAAAGATVSVTWDGPDYERDYLSVARVDQAPSKYANYTYTRRGNPGELLMPAEPGDYEIRYVNGADSQVLATRPIKIVAITAGLDAPPQAEVGAEVEINWTGPNYTGDFVSVADVDMPDSKYIGYAYTRHGSPAKVKMPSDPGTYELRYVQNQGSKILARDTIEVIAVSASLAADATAKVGADLSVTWTGPGYQRDFIAIAKPDMKDTKYVTYVYARHGSPAVISLPAEPGEYELRYVINGTPDKVMARLPITLEAVTASLNAPETGAAGGVVMVDWTGPGYKRDYVAIAPKGGKKYLGYAYTRNGNPAEVKLPDAPGEYEIWYVMKTDNTILARRPLTVE